MATFATPHPIAVRAEVVLGGMRVTASDRNDTVVEVRPTRDGKAADLRAVEQTRVEYRDDVLSIRTPKSWRRHRPFGGDGSVDIAVDLPTGSRLEVDLAVGDLRVEGEVGDCRCRTGMGSLRIDHAGEVELTTGYGDVDLDRAAGSARITTGSGEIRAGDVVGPTVVRNSNGATRLGAVDGVLRVKAANGDIRVGRTSASVVAKTACGSIHVGEVRSGTVVVETAAGGLEVGIADGVAAWLDLRSTFGEVRSELPPSDAPDGRDGTAEVRGRTSYGDISIFRAGPDAQVAS